MSNVSADLKEHIEDYIEQFLYDLTYRIIARLPGKRTKKNTVVLTSSGGSVTVIPRDKDFILQGYHRLSTFHKLIDFYERVNANPDPRTKYIVRGRPVADGIFEFLKLHPLNEYSPDIKLANRENIIKNIKQIKIDIRKAIDYLHSIGVRHGDTRMDNVGYDLQNDVFVLFDYDKINLSLTRDGAEDDDAIFEKSVKYVLAPPK
jgi:hypothetical protein